MTIKMNRAVPILRIFAVDKAKEFYVDFLGFTLDWTHTHDATAPVYMQVSRGDVVLHLSEHYGGGSPGAALMIEMTGIADFHAELTAKNYRFARPGLEHAPWGARMVSVSDPFSNKLTFSEAD